MIIVIVQVHVKADAVTAFEAATRDNAANSRLESGVVRFDVLRQHEDPARFAEWVLRDNPDWPRQKIDAAMKGERPTRVNLKQPLTVVLFYDTVHVNSEGVVFFADDIYAHDRALDAALVRGYPYAIKKS